MPLRPSRSDGATPSLMPPCTPACLLEPETSSFLQHRGSIFPLAAYLHLHLPAHANNAGMMAPADFWVRTRVAERPLEELVSPNSSDAARPWPALARHFSPHGCWELAEAVSEAVSEAVAVAALQRLSHSAPCTLPCTNGNAVFTVHGPRASPT